MAIRRIYVEKKDGFNVEAHGLMEELRTHLNLNQLKGLRILHRYDTDYIDDETYNEAIHTIYSEPPVDKTYEEEFPSGQEDIIFGVEYLPGQYDQRADSLVQCIKLVNNDASPVVGVAKLFVLSGSLSQEEIDEVKKYVINPVDSREAMLSKAETLELDLDLPSEVETVEGFIDLDAKGILALWKQLGLAMTDLDLLHTQTYFKSVEMRNPTITEIRALDTYWSDHCRHTTFLTELKKVTFEESDANIPLVATYKQYLEDRDLVYGKRIDEKPVCLMDIALMAMKKMRKTGYLEDLEVSDEINACSIIVPVDVDGITEEWLIMFKNETHNHPTEIEPFGGAATCLGGAIRDPLSGRSYVYQAMRVTGAADPRLPVHETMEGKLPQRKIVTESAHGYSSYGNQIGLATGLVKEIYHPNYVAKRLEIGAVIAAAPRENVIRETSDPGDAIIILGGRTGRDGCGGATGSSKEHTADSIHTCGAEVQKGNPPTERKIQRLFRNKEVSQMIKKCNDFGAGGISVAIVELADGLIIDLDKVPKKYDGLDGTELSISESQERMAVVVDPKDIERFIQKVEAENLEAVHVARVTEEKRLVMNWQGKSIVNIRRDFLDTNGARVEMDAHVLAPKSFSYFDAEAHEVRELVDKGDFMGLFKRSLVDLNSCSQRGLVERFDSSIGAGSVFMPYGGKSQNTPMDAMVAKIPLLKGETKTGTVMTYGYNPYLSSWSPYHGSVYAIVDSIAKVVASGGKYEGIRFTFQEYFKRLGQDASRWGQPLSAMLGAYYIQDALNLPSIGGKDSMSGTFHDIDVPPTLVSFAVDVVDVSKSISNEFKHIASHVAVIKLPLDQHKLPDIEALKENYTWIYEAIQSGDIVSAMSVPQFGLAEAVSKMCFGNQIGFEFEDLEALEVFTSSYGSIIIELKEAKNPYKLPKNGKLIGKTIAEKSIRWKETSLDLDQALTWWEEPLEDIFPTKTEEKGQTIDKLFNTEKRFFAKTKVVKPSVFIPVFPGTNCEYDTRIAFEKAGADVNEVVFRNLTSTMVEQSVKDMVEGIKQSQMIVIPGGFSAGDEPDGSGKFIATVFRNPEITEAVMELLNTRDGLMLGICNGFQALIKLGLVPYGEILNISKDAPTLTYNSIGRHISRIATTKVMSNHSPWLAGVTPGDIHQIPVSHGEGRFVASQAMIKDLFDKGQVVTTYVDKEGKPSLDVLHNPNGSMYAIEGIMSATGRVLGKMGHSERIGNNVAKNIYGKQDQKLFESGVKYFI
jgi:phosphoribosylformylglycinamidine synthase